MADNNTTEERPGFELDGVEAFCLPSGAVEITEVVERGVVFMSPHIARALRDWLVKVLP